MLSADLRQRLADAAVALGRQLDYRGAGTVEFLVDLDRGEFSFLEINTRVQVEHPVTEMVTGVDIVREQLRIAAGEPLSFGQDDVAIARSRHRVPHQRRIGRRRLPPVTRARSPAGIRPSGDHVRVDSHAFAGYEIPPYYDSLIAKLIVDRRRPRARRSTASLNALDDFEIEGVETTRELHRAVLSHDDFRNDAINTRWLETTLLPELTSTPTAKESTDG